MVYNDDAKYMNSASNQAENLNERRSKHVLCTTGRRVEAKAQVLKILIGEESSQRRGGGGGLRGARMTRRGLG